MKFRSSSKTLSKEDPNPTATAAYLSKPKTSPISKGVFGANTNYVSPKTNRYPPETKKLRDQVTKTRKQEDKETFDKGYVGAEISDSMSTDQMEHDPDLRKTLTNVVAGAELSALYGAEGVVVLNPADYVVIQRNNRPYMMGSGLYGDVFLAQHRQSGMHVAFKTFGVHKTIVEVLKECGFHKKAQPALAQNGFTPATFLGLLKIKQDSRLLAKYFPIVSVIRVASLVEDVPLCLPLSQAIKMLRKGKVDIKPHQWRHIMNLIVRAVQVLNGVGIRHGDYHRGNLCITYDSYQSHYHLAVLDFGEADYLQANDSHRDMQQAMAILAELAELFSWENTRQFANRMTTTRDFDFRVLLEELSGHTGNDHRLGTEKAMATPGCMTLKRRR